MYIFQMTAKSMILPTSPGRGEQISVTRYNSEGTGDSKLCCSTRANMCGFPLRPSYPPSFANVIFYTEYSAVRGIGEMKKWGGIRACEIIN